MSDVRKIICAISERIKTIDSDIVEVELVDMSRNIEVSFMIYNHKEIDSQSLARYITNDNHQFVAGIAYGLCGSKGALLKISCKISEGLDYSVQGFIDHRGISNVKYPKIFKNSILSSFLHDEPKTIFGEFTSEIVND